MNGRDPVAGDRVVVRYRLTPSSPADWRDAPNPPLPHSPTLSDITGVLVSADAAGLRIDRDGTIETVPNDAVVSLRTLSRRVVRNSQIRDLERALCTAADASERAEIDGWIVQASGATDADVRARAAVPIEFTASAAAVSRIREWYSARDAISYAILPDRLVRPGSIPYADAGYAIEVLVADTAEPGTLPDDLPEVAVGPGRWAVQVRADDDVSRTRARDAGYALHHTGRVVRL
ncbi:GNAT family N-acetyltransferase, cg3035/Rv0428c family [Gordonia zhaorongruii]|uniref:GNAT family N-acetyltransferase, cg3035/Rv0428c family n=1 Tax=Gordonia zhaorongruii TaxID=2597659 RepID=UPI00117E83CA|nr:GCN5 family acetyltransferase [Gordonia zhaorongruii]